MGGASEDFLNCVPHPIGVNLMSKYFKNLNTAKIFAEDFSQEPKDRPGLASGRAGIVEPHFPALRDRRTRQGSLSAVGRPGPAPIAANQRFTLIGQIVRNPKQIAGAKDVIVAPANPVPLPKLRIDRMKTLTTALLERGCAQ